MKIQPIDRLHKAGLAASPHAVIVDDGHDGLRTRGGCTPSPAGNNLGRRVRKGSRARRKYVGGSGVRRWCSRGQRAGAARAGACWLDRGRRGCTEGVRAGTWGAVVACAGDGLDSGRGRRADGRTCSHSARPCGYSIIIIIVQEV